MKIKNDFVTNSSSTSFVIQSFAKFEVDGKVLICERHGEDVSTLDMLKIIEGELQYNFKIKTPLNIKYKQNVWSIHGDGWDGGDYTFAGSGGVFFGQSNILNLVMTKPETVLKFDGEKLEIPTKWIEEFDYDYIEKNFKDYIRGYKDCEED